MNVIKEKIEAYINDVYVEMKRRGFNSEEIPAIIGKTGFIDAAYQFPELQMHYDVEDAVDEILTIASS
ncbi:MAG: hypothetical protein K5769_00460 [Pseudobutyrivibrio sp.]|nr:hypothetical protein [Pseudobutyrivibrio sp.]